MGLILVKELLMVDEDAGVHIRDLRLRELPFMRCMANAPCTALCIAVQRRHNAPL